MTVVKLLFNRPTLAQKTEYEFSRRIWLKRDNQFTAFAMITNAIGIYHLGLPRFLTFESYSNEVDYISYYRCQPSFFDHSTPPGRAYPCETDSPRGADCRISAGGYGLATMIAGGCLIVGDIGLAMSPGDDTPP
jgi:hypothetical protein